MKASQVRVFEEVGVVACVLLVKGEDYLEIGEHGMLAVPSDVKPTGFNLVVAVREGDRTIVVQKNVGKELGGYHRHALSEIEGFAKGFQAHVMREAIDVVRAGSNVWTSWHQDRPNRVDIWSAAEDGTVWLFQVGVITHDDGKTWFLHGEYRWRGQFFVDNGRIVGRPEHPKWGKFDVRRAILDHPDFVALVRSARLSKWQGRAEELEPPLGPIPGPGFARMQWYVTFAGQSGQGPATLHDGSNAWVHGVDIVGVDLGDPATQPLWQGDLVSYEGTARFGSKSNGPPKLTGVRLVKRG